MRLNRDRQLPGVSAALATMMRGLQSLQHATSINILLGQEGAATAQYWRALGLLAKPTQEEFCRSRPANDPLNAAINYLTGILERDIRAAIQSVALLPGLGFFHGKRDRHDGLVFDLMEPFRAPLTEGLPIFLLNANRLRAEMFTKGNDHVLITEEGRRALVRGYEAAVARRVNQPDGGKKLAWRPLMRAQAKSLSNALRLEDATRFLPYMMEA